MAFIQELFFYLLNVYKMPFPFNKTLWEYGRKIEDTALPIINQLYECDFKRNENDIFDILDFHDPEQKKIVEIKGRRIPHDRYEDTIITTGKVTEGFKAIDQGYRVFFVFVFTDKMFQMELKEDQSFKCKLTGTNSIPHYLIPVKELTEIKEEDFNVEEPIEEDNEQ